MSFSGEPDSHDSLLRSHFADDLEAGDSRNSFAQDGINDSPRKPLDQVAPGPMQPFTMDGSNLKDPGSLLSTFKSSIRIYFHQQQTNSTSWLRPNLKPFLRRITGRHLRVSNFVLYLVIAYLSILGLIHVVSTVLDALEVRSPAGIDWVLSHWQALSTATMPQPASPSLSAMFGGQGLHKSSCSSSEDRSEEHISGN